jgi:GTP-binding protein Era
MRPHSALGKVMLQQMKSALVGADLLMWVVDASQNPTETDRQLARMILMSQGDESSPDRRLVCLNKMDKLPIEFVQKRTDEYCKLFETPHFMLTTATKSKNLDKLVELIEQMLPIGEPVYATDEFTTQPMRFYAAEAIREKILRKTRQEVPHAVGVFIDCWEEEENLTKIMATILVERHGQKGIIIGKKGAMLKEIGSEVRLEIEELIGKKVFLELYVKVQEGWRENPKLLLELESSE